MGEYFVKSSGAICEQGVFEAGEKDSSTIVVIVFLLCNLAWLLFQDFTVFIHKVFISCGKIQGKSHG